MKKTAVICEINPYHKGHQYIFSRAREESDLVIAVMSGNFTQRAIPAVFDKYTRAALLLTPDGNGTPAADIVAELPFPWCCGGTEVFAPGGVAVALGLGADELVCGSECGDTDTILRAGNAKNAPEYLHRLMELEKEEGRGEGSAVLTDRVMKEFGFSLGANDKLAAEYARCLGERGELRVFPRITGEDTPYKSASDLRSMIYSGRTGETAPYVPPHAYGVYTREEARAVTLTPYLALAHTYCRLFARSGEVFAEGGGGLWEHILSAAGSARDAEAFFSAVGTKKYTDARIRRAILFAMLRVTGEMLAVPPAFTVLLGANERGRAYLSSLRKKGTFPILTKPSHVPEGAATQYAVHTAADRLYTMCMTPAEEADHFMKKHPVIV